MTIRHIKINKANITYNTDDKHAGEFLHHKNWSVYKVVGLANISKEDLERYNLNSGDTAIRTRTNIYVVQCIFYVSGDFVKPMNGKLVLMKYPKLGKAYKKITLKSISTHQEQYMKQRKREFLKKLKEIKVEFDEDKNTLNLINSMML